MTVLDLRFLARWSDPHQISDQEPQYLGDELAPSVLGTVQKQVVRAALDRQRLNLGRVDELSCEGADIY